MFERGETLQLQTGGREVTFLKLDQNGKAICSWRSGDTVRVERFALGELKRANLEVVLEGAGTRS